MTSCLYYSFLSQDYKSLYHPDIISCVCARRHHHKTYKKRAKKLKPSNLPSQQAFHSNIPAVIEIL